MPVEGATTIADLDVTYPNSGDPISQSDDHHRQNKNVLKLIFKGVGGDGFAIPIEATEAEINFLQGLTSNLQAQLNALVVVDGTKLNKDGSDELTGAQSCSVARTADDEFCRSVDFAEATLGGTMKARYVSGTKTLYLSNTDAIDP